MKFRYFLILSLLIPIVSFAQSSGFEYKVNSPYKAIKNLDFEFFSNPKLGVTVSYKIYYGFSGVTMQSYDTKSMKEITNNKLDRMIRNLAWIGDKLYGFYEFKATRTSTPYIYAREIDYKTCEFKGKEIKLFSSSEMIQSRISPARLADILITHSEDKSKTLIYINQIVSATHNSVTMLTIDQNFEKSNSYNYKIPHPEKQIEDKKFIVDNDGTPYMIYKAYEDKSTPLLRSQRKKINPNYTINLVKFNLEEKQYNKVKLPFEDYLVRGVTLFSLPDKRILITGYYNVDEESKGVLKEQNVTGGFLTYLDSDLKNTAITTYEIPKKIIYQYTESWKKFNSKKIPKKDPLELMNLVVNDLILGEDNSLTIIGEQQYTSIVTSHDKIGVESNSPPRFHYENLIITKLNKDGEVIWMTKVPKRMRGQIDLDGPGYFYANTDKDHYFFINDHRDNATLKEDGKIILQTTENHGDFCAFKVNNKTGKLSKHIIFDMMDTKGFKVYDLRVDRLMQHSETEFILECYKKKKEDILIKVKIKD